jgi:hypothetical protein
MNNMKLIVTLSLCVGLQACAHNDPWTERDTMRQTAVTILLAADALQTSQIQFHPELEEVGTARHFIGAQPSTTDALLYFVTSSVVSAVIARALPAKWRPWYQGGMMVISAKAIIGNCQYGTVFCPNNHVTDHEDYP